MTCAVNSIFDCAGVCNFIHFANNKERTGKYVAATEILNQAFIAKITAN